MESEERKDRGSYGRKTQDLNERKEKATEEEKNKKKLIKMWETSQNRRNNRYKAGKNAMKRERNH